MSETKTVEMPKCPGCGSYDVQMDAKLTARAKGWLQHGDVRHWILRCSQCNKTFKNDAGNNS